MKAGLQQALAVVTRPQHLKRTALVALIVGSWLTLFNQGDVLLSQAMTAKLAAKILLNYLTPFIVANLGLLSRQ